MNFNRLNVITGWIVCAIACAVYMLTAEAGGSLWDCGEFVSSAFKLQIPHPPGAPMFVLLGRLFIILFGDNPQTAAYAVNTMSALASGFTILFLFWTITHFGKKIAEHQQTQLKLADENPSLAIRFEPTMAQSISIMGAGIVGALAYTFSDSFWYSAVEGEVYALSSFFTAIVFWAILKWENQADEPGADRWIVFIFFMMGLSIGVHLLNLLTIPAIMMVYYFRRHRQLNLLAMRKWFMYFLFGGGLLALFAAMYAGRGKEFENGASIEFDGTLAGLVILAVPAVWAIHYFIEKQSARKEFWGGAFIFFLLGCGLTGVIQIGIIQYTIKLAGAFDRIFVNDFGMPFFVGFSFFFVLLIAALVWAHRYAVKHSINYLRLAIWCVTFMLIGYSTYFTTLIRSNANPSVDMYNVDNPLSLVGYLSREQYGDFPLVYGQKFTARPIAYDMHGDKYQKGKTEEGKDRYVVAGKDFSYAFPKEDKMIFPRMWDMQNEQGHADYYAYYTGIQKYRNQQGEEQYERSPTFIDNLTYFIGYQNYYMYLRYFLWNFSGKQNDVQGQFAGNVRDGNWITGIGLIDNIMYGDQSLMPESSKNNKAHNRFFLLPLILGIGGMVYHFKRRVDDGWVNFLMFFFTGFAIVLYLNQPGYQPRERDYAYVGSFYAFAVWIGLGVLWLQDLIGRKLPNAQAAAGIAFVLSFIAVPVLMAQQGWDDHDRSRKVLARDLAKDYLMACAPNAVVFSFGDNDTYPLWYAQEVEGIRQDVRVINTSLLGIDWYINQLRYKVNNSAPVDVILSAEQIQGGKREYVTYKDAGIPSLDLYKMIKDYVGSDDPSLAMDRGGNDPSNTFPTRNVTVDVDAAFARSSGAIDSNEAPLPQLQFTINKGGLMRNDLAMLAVIGANYNKRPIYFTSFYDELGFGMYLRKEGLSYRLAPVANQNIYTNKMYKSVMEQFAYGNANLPGVYFDEENRRHLNSIRRAHSELAIDLALKGRKEEAQKVLQKADAMLMQENMPYGLIGRGNEHNRLSMYFLRACYLAGEERLAKKVYDAVRKDLKEQQRFYAALSGNKAESMAQDADGTAKMIAELDGMKAELEQAMKPRSLEAIPSLPEQPAARDTAQKTAN